MKWIINPEVDFVSILANYGRFLENDYRMLIEHLAVPKIFEEYSEKTNRKFIIVGDNNTPWLLPKNVFLCLKLAGPDSITVKTPNLDEAFMVQNVFDYYAEGIKTKIFVDGHDETDYEKHWRDAIEDATDIIVFGNKNVMQTFREYETVERRVWERGDKFSFGIIKEEHLTPTNINQICFDFFSFYGEGSLAPKFYFVIGKIRKKHVRQFSDNMIALYGGFIQEYRNKLSFSKRSELVSQTINANYASKYIRVDDLTSEDIFSNLYGDVRLIQVNDLDEINQFIIDWQDQINTVSINMDDDDDISIFLEDLMITRICHLGDMQFPNFFDQYDSVDDFNIYVDEE
jgi:hypothetical protein